MNDGMRASRDDIVKVRDGEQKLDWKVDKHMTSGGLHSHIA